MYSKSALYDYLQNNGPFDDNEPINERVFLLIVINITYNPFAITTESITLIFLQASVMKIDLVLFSFQFKLQLAL